jgi:polysaccharide pyruvyl transferase CsaB
MNQKKFVICGNYGATNIGDEAILEGLINLIRSALPSAEITVLSANPPDTAAHYNVQSENKFPAGIRSFIIGIFDGSIKKTLCAIKNCDYFILGGGGLFTDEKFRAIIIWSLQAQIAYFYRKPILCLGQSVGPLKSRLGRFFTKRVFKHACAVTVRDKASSRLLHELGLPVPPVFADTAFAIKNLPHPPEMPEDYIVISVRPWIKGDPERLYKICAQFIDYIWDRFKYRAILVPFQMVHDNDIAVLNKIFAQVKNPESAQIFEFTEDLNKVLNLINNSRAVVGMRLHSLIFSTLLSKPFIALSYSKKVTNFMSESGMLEFCLEWENLKFHDLKDVFERLISKQDKIHEDLLEKSILMRADTRKHEEIFTL